MNNKGFSLTELLVTVALIGILASIGIVSYNGYVASAKKKEATTGLNSIYLGQSEYLAINKQFYIPSGGCGDQTAIINTNLFGGDSTLNNENYTFCITGSSSSYNATATSISNSTQVIEITNTGAKTNW
jgi:prepilin-type N-terminal cleavage/methylation domain-containing protein